MYYINFFGENSYGKISLSSIAQKDWQGLMNVLGNKTTGDGIKQFTSVRQWATFRNPNINKQTFKDIYQNYGKRIKIIFFDFVNIPSNII